MKLQCRGPTGVSSFPNAPAMVETASIGTFDRSEGKMAAEAPIKSIAVEESAEQAERAAGRKARKKTEGAAKERAKREREERERVRIEREERKREEAEPEQPLSLWERKKLIATTQPAPASSLYSGGDSANSSGVWGDAGGSGGDAKTIAVPTFSGNGDPQAIFTDMVRDQKRQSQREILVEGFLGPNPPRRSDDSSQLQMTAKPTPKSTQVPPPPPSQKSWGWGGTAWGGKNLTVDTTTKPPEIGPNTAGPENIPESAVEIKQVPVPGKFHSSAADKKDGA